ncbi:helix-turn-helix domain-containing protein [Formosa algae]|uniref:AraC-like DNA-binding protein n=1 Tax=Formosa algae TaxID=225843 RepID=A0A9X0YM15_9FLAO|nr:AraC family transcriptional regulator [Formosa algae]MBP1839436.1 AraC-like DNA-binding protein [Formosa algae]MDQ0334740.1 AraC-like DNA-binding protein [Formosa algae]OEI81992.1 AraC family transcriptional regulator [Formosa algae]
MKTLHIKSTSARKMINDLQEHIGGTTTSLNQEYVLTVDNDLAYGSITAVSIKKSITYIAFDIEFKKDFRLVNTILKSSPIYFTYCSEGQVEHSFSVTGKTNTLDAFQTAILRSKETVNNVYHFEKDILFKFSTVVVSTDDVSLANNDLNAKLNELFTTKNDTEHFAYFGSYNLKISEKIKQLEAIKQQGVVRRLLVESTVQTILALEIQQHTDDLEVARNTFGSLCKDEMETVKDVSQFITNYPEKQYTLKYLSTKSGLTPSKLQEGFKLLHDRTVTDFIRNVRVETAENLIKTTDLNISEIVYTVGLTSRSYFSKIFKEKYNCSPKQYQDNQNSLAATA